MLSLANWGLSPEDIQKAQAKLTDEERQKVESLIRQPPDRAYQHDPVGWMRDTLQIPEHTLRWSLLPEYANHKWDGTPDPLATIAEAIAQGKDVGVESGTGTGKTYLAAGLALWFNACFEDSLTITTAPKAEQLKAQLWKEVGQHWPKFQTRYPMASTVELRVRMREGAGEQERWAIIGYGCGVDAGQASATRAQGFHAAHMLIITEETPGIDGAVMTAFGATATGDHNIQLSLGNPDFQLDELHKFCIRPGVVHVIISALDHPNVVCGREVIPGAAGRKSVAKFADEFGGVESPMFKSRVRGISPAESTNALIKLDWCKRSADRHKQRRITPDDLPAMGIDVAQSETGDKASKARGRGNWLHSVESFRCTNATELGRDVAKEAKQQGVLPKHVGVDAIGLGAATVNALREELGSIRAIISGSSPIDGAQQGPDGEERSWMPDANRFENLRSQMWWQMREDLRTDAVDLPDDSELHRQLTMPQFKDEGKVVKLEAKDEIRKRLGRSPDDADAVVYWNWIRPRRTVTPVRDVETKEQDRAPKYDFEKRRWDRVDSEQALARETGFHAETRNRHRVPRGR